MELKAQAKSIQNGLFSICAVYPVIELLTGQLKSMVHRKVMLLLLLFRSLRQQSIPVLDDQGLRTTVHWR